MIQSMAMERGEYIPVPGGKVCGGWVCTVGLKGGWYFVGCLNAWKMPLLTNMQLPLLFYRLHLCFMHVKLLCITFQWRTW